MGLTTSHEEAARRTLLQSVFLSVTFPCKMAVISLICFNVFLSAGQNGKFFFPMSPSNPVGASVAKDDTNNVHEHNNAQMIFIITSQELNKNQSV